MGLDLGKKNIGIAVSDPLGFTAQPVTVLQRTGRAADTDRLLELCRNYEVKEIVVGYPLNMNGSVGPAAREAELFRKHLAEKTGLSVHLWDERLSTSHAEKLLLEGDMSRLKRKKLKDKLAATIILESFLSSRRTTN